MTEEKIVKMAKKFSFKQYNELCDTIEDFETKYKQEVNKYDTGYSYTDEMIATYKDKNFLPDGFPCAINEQYSHHTHHEVHVAAAKYYVDRCLNTDDTTMIYVLCCILHEYFDDCLDKI